MTLIERDRPPGVRERRFVSAEALAEQLSVDIAGSLDAALRAQGKASLVVSGGKTPIPLFRRLSRLPLDWHDVHVTLADERWVEPDDPASNEGLARRELLQESAAAARFVGLKNSSPTPQQGAVVAWQRLEVLPRPFDVVVLGMGEDGHFASLFPNSPGIAAALDPRAAPACVATSAPVAPNARLSLNVAAILQARRVVLHIDGARKWEIYRDAARLAAASQASGGPAGGPPITVMLRQRSPGLQVYWSP